MKLYAKAAALCLLVGAVAAAPSGAAPSGAAPSGAAPSSAAPSSAAPSSAILRVGILPDADSLPLLVAEAEGLFAKEGARVELVTFKAAVERDAALQSGAVDGVISDLLAAALAVQGGFELRVTSLTDGRYGIVTAPGSGLDKPEQLRGVEVGISSNTIIEYATHSLLFAAGVPVAEIKGLPVPKIPVRMELLLTGQLKAACLPEPLLSAAQARGARLVAASDDAGLRAGVLLFTKKSLDTRLADITAFYRAYATAAARINADPAKYRPFLVDKAGFPAEVKDSYRFVRYEKPRLPSEADVRAVVAWMRSRGLLAAEVQPAAILDGRALSGF